MPGLILTIVGFISLFLAVAIIYFFIYKESKSCMSDKEEK